MTNKIIAIFINDFGRLRSGWRLLLFVFAYIAALFLLTTLLRGFYVVLLAFAPQLPTSGLVPHLIFRLALLAAALGAGYLCARFLESMPWRSLGLTLHQGWLRDLLIGSVVGFVSLALAIGIAAAAGGLQFSVNDASTLSIGQSMLHAATLLIVAALAEEAMFRGYAFQTLSRARLATLGLLLTSVTFSLVHLSNPNVVPTATFANTLLAGVWLGVAYLRTRSLWLPLGVHWSWNWALGWFFGVPISGLNLVSHPLLIATDEGPAWLTGGKYGIEGGLACTVALIISTVFVWRFPWLKATAELKMLTSEEFPATREPALSIRNVE